MYLCDRITTEDRKKEDAISLLACDITSELISLVKKLQELSENETSKKLLREAT